MPISMLLPWEAVFLFMLHHRMVTINASSSFLIDMPTSMPLAWIIKHLFMLHHRVAFINPSKS